MGIITRRRFVQLAASASVLAGVRGRADASGGKLRIGVTDWNLNLGADPEAVPLAAKLGFEGVQVSFGRKIANGKMPADDPATIERYLQLSRDHHIPIDGTCVDRLHDNGLKSDPQAVNWVHDSIRLTKALGTHVLLLPFFGKWALRTQAEMDYTADALRELGPEAERAGVVLGVEDTISAKDNARILDRAKSGAVKVYYDVGNSTIAGFNPVEEIRWLGKDRICQFHLKDNPHLLGEGSISFAPILRAIDEIGFHGFANLETDSRPNRLEADLSRNLEYIQSLMQKA